MKLPALVSLFFFAIAGVSIIAPPSAAAAEPLKVFIFAGQSNMVGKRSQTAELPPKYQSTQDKVLMFVDGAWKPYEPGLGQTEGFGPEATCAPDLAAALTGSPDSLAQIGIIKHSIGGTNLARQWDPENPKSLYAVLKKKVEAAGASRPIEVVGMFWMQGEADAKDKAMGRAYGENLKKLIEAAREDFGNPGMFFVAGRINPHPPRVMLEEVRAAQTMEAPHYGWVDCDDLTKVSDNVHYDTKGQALMGQRMAEKALALMKSE